MPSASESSAVFRPHTKHLLNWYSILRGSAICHVDMCHNLQNARHHVNFVSCRPLKLLRLLQRGCNYRFVMFNNAKLRRAVLRHQAISSVFLFEKQAYAFGPCIYTGSIGAETCIRTFAIRVTCLPGPLVIFAPLVDCQALQAMATCSCTGWIRSVSCGAAPFCFVIGPQGVTNT